MKRDCNLRLPAPTTAILYAFILACQMSHFGCWRSRMKAYRRDTSSPCFSAWRFGNTFPNTHADTAHVMISAKISAGQYSVHSFKTFRAIQVQGYWTSTNSKKYSHQVLFCGGRGGTPQLASRKAAIHFSRSVSGKVDEESCGSRAHAARINYARVVSVLRVPPSVSPCDSAAKRALPGCST